MALRKVFIPTYVVIPTPLAKRKKKVVYDVKVLTPSAVVFQFRVTAKKFLALSEFLCANLPKTFNGTVFCLIVILAYPL